jgi:hypothetical protein
MSRAWAICDRCGFKHRHSALRKEWTGLLVCKPCWDPRPPDTKPPKLKPEGLPVRDARPEPTPVFREEGEYGGDDL